MRKFRRVLLEAARAGQTEGTITGPELRLIRRTMWLRPRVASELHRRCCGLAYAEGKVEGDVQPGDIDWDALLEWLKELLPLILEFIKELIDLFS